MSRHIKSEIELIEMSKGKGVGVDKISTQESLGDISVHKCTELYYYIQLSSHLSENLSIFCLLDRKKNESQLLRSLKM